MPPARARQPRQSPEKSLARLTDIAEAATTCFSETGFRRTQVADIARRMGVSVGTLYLYADSKEALFHLAVMHVTKQPLAAFPVPVTDPGIHETTRLLTSEVASRSLWPTLKAALASSRAPDLVTLEAIGAENYDTLTQERRTIWLLDACNLDIPELNTIYRRNVRGTYLADLMAYMERVASPSWSAPQKFLAIRAAVEILAWAAMHRRREQELPDELHASETEARNAAKRCFASALLGMAD
tara:strand:+ start:10389 stop:11114 length:726 start_codon:yes stop_codon:yes gene_type:complete